MLPYRSNCHKKKQKNEKELPSLPYLHLGGTKYPDRSIYPKNTKNETQYTETAVIAWKSQKNEKSLHQLTLFALRERHSVPNPQ